MSTKILIENINFDENNNELSFIIKRYTKKPKITRYVTKDYERTPIYGGYSERTKILKKFKKTIIPFLFLSKQVLESEYLNRSHIDKLISIIKFTPEWRKDEKTISYLKQLINNLKKHKTNLESQKKKPVVMEINYRTNPDSKISFFEGFFFYYLL